MHWTRRCGPVDESEPSPPCRTNYENSERILIDSGFESGDFGDIFDVLKSRGGFCDCEIPYNVVGNSRMKSKYW
jgi:hypothetical protein